MEGQEGWKKHRILYLPLFQLSNLLMDAKLER